MYAILTKNDHTVLINKNSLDYTDYVFSGYKEILQGTKKECLAHLEQSDDQDIKVSLDDFVPKIF